MGQLLEGDTRCLKRMFFFNVRNDSNINMVIRVDPVETG